MSAPNHAPTAAALAIVVLVSALPFVAAETDPPESRPLHAPVVIAGDGGFLLPPELSGVVGGSGTEEDPYVIEGWTFVVPSGPMRYYERDELPTGILLHRTSAHVVVRGNTFLGTPDWTGPAGVADEAAAPPAARYLLRTLGNTNETAPAVSIVGSQNVLVEENLFIRAGAPAVVVQREGLRGPKWHVATGYLPPPPHCIFDADACTPSREVVIARNTFQSARMPAVLVHDAQASILSNEILAVSGYRPSYLPAAAIAFDRPLLDSVAEGNQIRFAHASYEDWLGPSIGILVTAPSCFAQYGAVVRGNALHGFPTGIVLLQMDAALIEQNEIDSEGMGIVVAGCGEAEIRDNSVKNGWICIRAHAAGRVSGNTMDNCRTALVVSPDTDVDLTNTVDGCATYRLRDLEDTVVDAADLPAGWLYATGLRNVTLRNFDLGPAAGGTEVRGDPNATSPDAGVIIESSRFRGRAPDPWVPTLVVTGGHVRLTDVEVGPTEAGHQLQVVARHAVLEDVRVRGGRAALDSLGATVSLRGDGGTLHVRGGSYADSGWGLRLSPGTSVTAATTILVEDARFTGNNVGFSQQSQASARVLGSSFVGNALAVSAGTAPVDARDNWWGSPTGPKHASNPGGTGDRVSDNVVFDPWLASPP